MHKTPSIKIKERRGREKRGGWIEGEERRREEGEKDLSSLT